MREIIHQDVAAPATERLRSMSNAGPTPEQPEVSRISLQGCRRDRSACRPFLGARPQAALPRIQNGGAPPVIIRYDSACTSTRLVAATTDSTLPHGKKAKRNRRTCARRNENNFA